MIVMAALIYVPVRLLAALSVAIIALHNCLDGIAASQFGSAAGVWNLIHQPGAFTFISKVFVVGYPLVPWFAVMAAGFCFGQVFPARPRRAAADHAENGFRHDHRVRDRPCSEPLWRPGAVVSPGIGPVHRALFSQVHEISAIS